MVDEAMEVSVPAGHRIDITHRIRAALTAPDRYPHAHAGDVLARHAGLEDEVIDRLTRIRWIDIGKRTRTPNGIGSDELNETLKEDFRRGAWRFEATVQDGVVYSAPSPKAQKGGFDLAAFDVEENLRALWDLCFGRRSLRHGDRHWDETVRRWGLESDAAAVRAELESEPDNADRLRDSHLVVGELQFGNAHLRFKDLLKLLSARQQLPIDLLVYITATGGLSAAISGNTVKFSSMKKVLQEFESLIQVPVWLIGLDLPERFWELSRLPLDFFSSGDVIALRATHPELDFHIDVELREHAGRFMAAADFGEDSSDIGMGETEEVAVREALAALGEPYVSDIARDLRSG